MKRIYHGKLRRGNINNHIIKDGIFKSMYHLIPVEDEREVDVICKTGLQGRIYDGLNHLLEIIQNEKTGINVNFVYSLADEIFREISFNNKDSFKSHSRNKRIRDCCIIY